MIRAAVFLVIVSGILISVGWLAGGLYGFIVGILAAIFVDIVSVFCSGKIILAVWKASEAGDKKLIGILEALSQEAKIRQPKLYFIDQSAPNSFAVSLFPNKTAIAVTKGFLDLETAEIKSVLAHEIAHIKNKDIFLSQAVALIACAFAIPVQKVYYRLFFAGKTEHTKKVFSLIPAVIFAPIAAIFTRLSVSRVSEYRADFEAAMLTKDAKSLSKALKKICGVAKEYPLEGPIATSHLWIICPFHKNWVTSLFSHHPPVEFRIKRLEEMEGFKE